MKLHHPLQSHTSSVVPECIIGFAQTHHLFLPHPDTPHFSTGTAPCCVLPLFRTDIL